MNTIDVIARKRDGKVLLPEEIKYFIQGSVKGEIPDYQISAFLMAVFLNGMNLEETIALTQAMLESGSRVQFQDSKPKIDKHSTGGVGDKISLILAPLAASLGIDVPMIAGRGLGHTGGTLDKLESIPGFSIHMTISQFRDAVLNHGVAIMGQTEDLVPADKLLYALRDVTATVENISLITASILSKKAAEGLTGLVLDIKTGCGAFMKTQKEAEKLAKSMLTVGKKLGLKIRILITDMNQPLGFSIGHSLEVLEGLEVLQGKGPTDIKNLTIELAAHMLILGDKATSLSEAKAMARKQLQTGAALEKFREICRFQHATIDVTLDTKCLPLSPHKTEFMSPKSGYISKIDGKLLGLLVVDLGGGRKKMQDSIDPGVGIILHKKVGIFVEKGDSIATIYYNRLTENEVLNRMSQAYAFSAYKVKPAALIKKVVL